MLCVINEPNAIKTFARVVQCASKVADEVSFAPSAGGLYVRALSSAHSSCAEFLLTRAFFSSFAPDTLRRAGDVQQDFSVRVMARSLLPILRSQSSIRRLSLDMHPGKDRVLFEVMSRTAVIKRFWVPIQDGETVQAVFNKEACSSYLQAPSRFLLDILANFHSRLEEITFSPSARSLRVSSHSDMASTQEPTTLRTEMVVDAQQFELCQIAESGTDALHLSFSCKPFRAALEFCEVFEVPLGIWFAESGTPILFGIEIATPGLPKSLEATFVFATREIQVASQTPSSSGRTNGSRTTSHDSSPTRSLKRRRADPQPNLSIPSRPDSSPSLTGRGRRTSEGGSESKPARNPPAYEPSFAKQPQSQTVHPSSPDAPKPGARSGKTADGRRASRVRVPLGDSLSQPTLTPSGDEPGPTPPMPSASLQPQPRAGLSRLTPGDDDSEEDGEYVEGTPPPATP